MLVQVINKQNEMDKTLREMDLTLTQLNQTVIDEESIDGHPRGDGVRTIAIYHLRGDKIARVQFIM